MLAFVVAETDIKVVECTASLLKGHMMEAVGECYYKALHQGHHLEYNKVTLLKILTHINKSYAQLDRHIIKANRKIFIRE